MSKKKQEVGAKDRAHSPIPIVIPIVTQRIAAVRDARRAYREAMLANASSAYLKARSADVMAAVDDLLAEYGLEIYS